MNPRRYRGSAPVRFRAWVLPVVGGLAAGALLQYVGAVAMAPAEIRDIFQSMRLDWDGDAWMRTIRTIRTRTTVIPP